MRSVQGVSVVRRARARGGLQSLLCALSLAALLPATATAADVTIVKEGQGSALSVVKGWQLNFSGEREASPRIDCGSVCGPVFFTGSFFSRNAELEAFAAEGFTFKGWSGFEGGPAPDCQDGLTANPCRFTAPEFVARTFVATFGLDVDPPEVRMRDASEGGPVTDVTAEGATFHGAVNPTGSELESCRFEYLTNSEFEANPPSDRFDGAAQASCVPGPAAIGEGEVFVDVDASVVGLDANTAYHVRLVADKGASLVAATPEPNPTFATSGVPPTLGDPKAWSISDTTATLAATVDPENAPVVGCHFEYGDGSSFDRTAPCDQEPGSGGEPVQVTAEIGDLEPETEYQFRLLVANDCAFGCGGVESDVATFATYPPVTFPKRGFELASAVDTNGVGVVPAEVSADGEHLAYYSGLPVPGSENGAITQVSFVSDRRSDGSWAQRFVGAPPPPESLGGSSAPLFSADLSLAVWSASDGFDPDDANSASDVYARTADALTWLSRDPAIPVGTQQTEGAECGQESDEGPFYVSPDGSRVLFGCGRRLLPEDVSDRSSLYQLDDGELSLVGIEPGSSGGFPFGSTLGSRANRRVVGGENLYGGDVTRNAVSTDGSRVVFQSGADLSSQRLFVRLAGSETVEASASEGVAPAVTAPVGVNFWGADEDVESVFFTSGSALTADSNAPGSLIHPDNGGGSADLYRYSVPDDGDPGNGRLVDLTPASVHPGEAGAGVLQVLDVSDDGRRIYFIANGALTPGSKPGNCHKSGGSTLVNAGECNLYLARLDSHDDDSATLTLVARGLFRLGAGNGRDSAERPREVSAAPDGSLLAFVSPSALVPGRRTGGYRQVYVYDAARAELACISCPGDGSTPTGPGGLTPAASDGAGVVGGNEAVHYSTRHARNVVSADAVLFQAMAPLVPGDSNGLMDVYEWRGGKVALISTAGRFEAYFGGASADGATVVLGSANRLAPGGQNGIVAAYVARVGGGYQPPPPQLPCSGEGCRGSVSLPPVGGVAGTDEFHGDGNFRDRERGCKRNQIFRRGRCLSKRRLARHACRKRTGTARKRCIRRQMHRMARRERRRLRAEGHRAGNLDRRVTR